MTTSSSEKYVARQAEVEELLADYEDAPVLALDTEFIRESTYYPRLCLVQAAASGTVACIDCLGQLDVRALLQALCKPGRAWLVHSARQDLEAVWVHGDSKPAALIDTQLAAALLGFTPQISLQGLLESVLGVRLEKLHARTDWARRPLGAAELRYALDDVAYLAPLWSELERRLLETERLAWFAQDCAALLAEPYGVDLLQLMARIPGASRLEREQQLAALSLLEWREETAQRLDRPRRWILKDEAIATLARALPADEDSLTGLSDLPRRLAPSMAAGLCAAIKARNQTRFADELRSRDEAAPDRGRVKEAQEAIKRHAAELGLVPEVLATRREIEQFVAAGRAARTEWRTRLLESLIGTPDKPLPQ